MLQSFQTQIFPIYFNSFVVSGADMVASHDTDWRKLYPETGNGLSSWALRSLLVVKGDSIILFDTGFGNKQDFSFFRPFQLEGEYRLDRQLEEIGLSRNDITDVVLTHLHYDHCGGCLLNEGGHIVSAFPQAQLWISSRQWENWKNPLEQEKDSLLDENIRPLPDYYPIRFVEEEGSYLPGIYFKMAHGHTKGQIIPIVRMGRNNLLFGADLFPSSVHLDANVNMIYDMDIQQTITEKQAMLEECIRNSYIIAFQHGLYIQACTVSLTKKGLEVLPLKLADLKE
jgi:glyoxylase-like metal-dependent hydrolase (beta-lactamase superfamily II)